jgi:SWI/SNF-related matrix-associated actin-dependent regulator 1 of chromatin subfamily A
MKTPTVPFPHQLEAVELFCNGFDRRMLMGHAMGTGKTFSALLTAKELDLRPMLVVCPASLKWQWAEQARTHLSWRCQVLEGTKPKRGGWKHVPGLTVLNYDILHAWAERLKQMNFRFIVFDESHFLSDMKTRWTRTAIDLCLDEEKNPRIPAAMMLTGTPIMNKVIDLFPMLHILRPDKFGNLFAFGHRYCNPKRGWGGHWEFKGLSNADELHQRLTSTCLHRVRKEDVIKDMPEKVRTVLSWDLDEREEYDKEVKDYLRVMAGRRFSKLKADDRAEAKGSLFRIKHLVARKKLPAVAKWVENFLEQDSGKLIVFCTHQDVIHPLHETFRKSVLVDGSVTGKKRKLVVEQFQRDPKCRIFFGNLRAAGQGLNLHAAHTVAFAELGWNPATMEQAEDRGLARLGNVHGMHCYYLVARNTIEASLLKLIQKKGKVSGAVIDGRNVSRPFDVFDKLTEALRKEQGE